VAHDLLGQSQCRGEVVGGGVVLGALDGLDEAAVRGCQLAWPLTPTPERCGGTDGAGLRVLRGHRSLGEEGRADV
jgi:hypothetical protein